MCFGIIGSLTAAQAPLGMRQRARSVKCVGGCQIQRRLLGPIGEGCGAYAEEVYTKY